ADLAWPERERSRLAPQAERLARTLRRAGFEIVGGTSLFRLPRSRAAARRFAALAGAGVLVRPFDDRRDWLLFGPPQAPVQPLGLGRQAAPLAFGPGEVGVGARPQG
ncbi:hypothetical protein HUS71_27120, partial [Pandoraea nosoerga]|nr:hypothetical protein [Pandoraea nosoerga]